MNSSMDISNDRLTVLYVISRYGGPVPYTSLMNAALRGCFMNYVDFSQLLSDMESDGYLSRYGSDGHVMLMLTDKGAETLDTLRDLVTQYAVRFADNYLPAGDSRGIRVAATYESDDPGRFCVRLTLSEGNSDVMDIRIPAYSKKDALDICSRFEENYSGMYPEIMDILLGKDRK